MTEKQQIFFMIAMELTKNHHDSLRFMGVDLWVAFLLHYSIRIYLVHMFLSDNTYI